MAIRNLPRHPVHLNFGASGADPLVSAGPPGLANFQYLGIYYFPPKSSSFLKMLERLYIPNMQQLLGRL